MSTQYSDAFISALTEYVGSESIEMEAYTKVEWAAGLFGSFKPYLDLAGKRYLDAGCGHGALAAGALNEGMLVDGFDLDDKGVHLTNLRLCEVGAPASAFVHDIRDPIPAQFEEAFDLVTSFQVLEHLPRGDQFTGLRRLAGMVKQGGFLFIDTENSLYPYDRHDTLLPLVRLLAPSVHGALAVKLGRSFSIWEPSLQEATSLHHYLSYDEVLGALGVLGFEVVDSVIPHGTMRQLFRVMTGSDWFYETIAQHFEAERFLPISALFQKTRG
jgi:2-polyprenyl-3-methyl-5-hydroxy-6-metoxy-1,4-benzoquinol methylase